MPPGAPRTLTPPGAGSSVNAASLSRPDKQVLNNARMWASHRKQRDSPSGVEMINEGATRRAWKEVDALFQVRERQS
jgi:hypothetical protein